MHGLINGAIQHFLQSVYGEQVWRDVAQAAHVEAAGFEPMLTYEDSVTEALIRAAAVRLHRPRHTVLEDLGAWLVRIEAVRRLLRFGGGDFSEFLFSLDEVQSRGQLALPDLELPELVMERHGGLRFDFRVRGLMPGWGAVLTGLLRAMADDYGALVLIEEAEARDGAETGWAGERISVELLDARFVEGRRFDLALPGLA